ncbi:Hsp70 family protein [Actinomycetospora soli]|uniref:Hsp70 family protein n=1 Tax=Actinomycetospora soli TaxID=2893887 RepID=UPI001E344E02|nr:Hsp70 family protein [Actinomycetospora soli]MCD2186530.1 Hsp70 family protein [Actinomycetospora soli]
MGYDLGVDLGGTTVVAAVLRDGEARADAVGLGTDGSPSMPATAHRGSDGVVRTGADAERRAALEPDRAVRDVTARLGDDVPLIVGDEPWRADDVAAEIVLAAVRRVAALEGGAARALAVTHPAGWGSHRERTLRRALVRVGLGHATLVAESRAAVLAASTYGGLRAGRVAAVYDLGGRRFRAAVIRRGARGVVASGTEGGAAAPGTTTTEVLADSGAPVRAGGTDVDAAVLAHVREELGEPFDAALAALDDNASRHALATLQRSARVAKERLSADTEAPLRVTVGPLDTTVRITRADLEARITPLVAATVDAFAGTLEAAGVTPDQVVLVGGSSRIPLVARLLAEELGRPVHPELDPITVVAEGAALAAAGHAAARRHEALTGPASGSFPTTGPASGAFPTTGPASGAFPTTGPASGAFPATGPASAPFAATAAGVRERRRVEAERRPVPTGASDRPAPVERHAAVGAAIAAGAALGASAARSRTPVATSAPASGDGDWGPPSALPATTEEARPARSGSTALMERPRTPNDDVPRPPVATAAAPVGEHAPQGVFQRYRTALLVLLVLLVLAAAAVLVPIPGLTTARTSSTTTTTPAPTTPPPGPTPAAAAPLVPLPPTGPASSPEAAPPADGTTEQEQSSDAGTTTRRPATTTRSSRTPTAQNVRPAGGSAPVAAPQAVGPAPSPAAVQPARPAQPAPQEPAASAPSPDVASPAAQAPAATPSAADTPVASAPSSVAPTTGTPS